MGKNMQVVCSDNLKIHMEMHEKLFEDSLNSIYSSRASLHKDDESEFSSSSTDWEAPEQRKPSLEREAIIKTIKLDAAEYKNKLKLGKIIYEEIEEHEIPEESLRRELRNIRKQRNYI